MTPSTPLRAGGLWNQYRRLNRHERATLTQAVAMVPFIHVALRVAGFNHMQKWVARTPAMPAPPPTADAVRVCVASVNRVKHFSLFPGNCLSQSLVLLRLLREHGVAADLQFGARVTGAKLDAHAWVVLDGQVLNDTDDVGSRFTPLVKGA